MPNILLINVILIKWTWKVYHINECQTNMYYVYIYGHTDFFCNVYRAATSTKSPGHVWNSNMPISTKFH